MEQDEKWLWMMSYCKKEHITPAHAWAWRRAENAWNLFKKKSIKR